MRHVPLLSGLVDRLCVFEDMLASIRRDGHPIIDLSASYEAIKRDRSTYLLCNREIDRDFKGSVYIHFGSTGVKALGPREVTGVYANAEHYPNGTVHGDLHFVGSDPDWDTAHENMFYDTLLTHQDAAVVMYEITPEGEVKFSIAAEDVAFGNEKNAYALLPFAKIGLDVALGKSSGYEVEVRTEFFHGGPNVRPEYCRMEVLDVARQPTPSAEQTRGPNPGM